MTLCHSYIDSSPFDQLILNPLTCFRDTDCRLIWMLSALFSIDHWLFGWRFYWTCSGRVSDSLIHWFMIHWPIIDSLLLYHRRTESGSLADWFGLLCLASLNYCRCLIVSLMSCFLGALKYWAMLCWIHWSYHWFGALRIWFADPSLHRFWSIACAVGLIVLWFIDPRIRTHWFDASPPIDQRARATEPLGHWATRPPGHRATGHQPPKVWNLWGNRMESGPCADSFTRLDPQVGGAIVGGKVDDSLAHGSDS